MISEKAVKKFKEIIKGNVIGVKDNGYDDSRKVWNGMIDKHPLFIVQCANDDDVVEAVKFAHEYKLITAVRGGGHNRTPDKHHRRCNCRWCHCNRSPFENLQ